MRAALIAAVFAALASPALADTADLQRALFTQGSELQAVFRQCTADAECATTHGVCGGWLAVNTASKMSVENDIKTVAGTVDCSPVPETPEPEARCGNALCYLAFRLKQ